MTSKVRKFSRKRQQFLGQLNGTVEEMISGYATVVAYNLQSMTTDDFCDTADSLTKAGIRTDIFSGVMGPVMNCIGNIGFVIKVALVGATGSGKTTIVNLLMRFYDIDSGEIRINNQNIKDISRKDLRKNVAIVLQDTVLFSDTIRNNLKYGNKNATDDQLEKAIEMSRCSDMIKHLPQGYDTVLYGAGDNISQGQRQLLAIARAFVADPKILILDEATSNVDTRTEKKIQTAMQKIMQGRTSIVIAHRLSTIRDSDMIIVMNHGEIVESGTHEELLEKKGKYHELYMTQYAGFSI